MRNWSEAVKHIPHMTIVLFSNTFVGSDLYAVPVRVRRNMGLINHSDVWYVLYYSIKVPCDESKAYFNDV